MSKTFFRYFFDFLDGQEKWLNSMAGRGYRLKKCGRIAYTFDQCQPNEYEYAVEFVGEKAYTKAKAYREYLESMGFRTFTKNINLNYSLGKVRWRPYGKGMGQIATSPGGFNKELLILEKKRDGQPFELHTDVSDTLHTYKNVVYAYAWTVLLLLGLVAITFIPNVSSMSGTMTWVFRMLLAGLGVLFIIPAISYASLVGRLKEESKLFE